MIYRYGEMPDAEFQSYKKRLHSMIHWLLVYSDENNSCLCAYFHKVQTKLAGLCSLLNDDPLGVELMVLVEAARLLAEEEPMDRRMYKKMILDAHEVIEKMFDAYGSL